MLGVKTVEEGNLTQRAQRSQRRERLRAWLDF